MIGGRGNQSPNEKLNIAGVGVGGMGKSNLAKCAAENIVALCDVDWKYSAPVFKKYPNARKWTDFRKMLDEMDNRLDAVAVCTPDHTHAVAAMDAMRRGKHVYCEKPLAHSIYEIRELMKAAHFVDDLFAGLEVEMVRICNEDLSSGLMEVFQSYRFRCGLSPHSHK